MNLEEVEEALRTINGHLLTDKELQFIYHVSELVVFVLFLVYTVMRSSVG